jgi:hypothetical protein
MNITASILRARVTQFGDVVGYMQERERAMARSGLSEVGMRKW